jgi:hypothetical protein
VKRIEDGKFVSERIEDVLDVASHYYNERLQVLGEKEKGEERRGAKSAGRMKEDREEERPEKRDKKRTKKRSEKREKRR